MGKVLDAATMVQELRDVFASRRTRSAEWRIEQLNALVRLVKEHGEELAEALWQDLGKPIVEASREIIGVEISAKAAAANVRKWMEPEKVSSPIPSMENAAIIPEPRGVALVISPWNFPMVLCLDPVIGAIVAGNCVVVKPSELAPASSAILSKLVPLYLDASAVRVVEGGISETTVLLEQRWDKIFYTGSTRVGRIVMAAAAKHLTPVTLELGGKSPTIVDSTADLDIVATRISRGKWPSSNGQACVSPDYVLAEESITMELVNKFKDTLKQFYGEDPICSPDICRIVNASHFKRLIGLLNDEKTTDKVVHGGQHNEKTLCIAPTLILDAPLDSPIMQEEIFGPLLVIITVKDVDEAIKIVNSQPKPLALYLFTTNEKVVDQVLQETSSGGVTVNNTMMHVAHPGLPFGGVGDSGIGSYHGKHSFDTFSHRKPVLYQQLTKDSTSTLPPYNRKT